MKYSELVNRWFSAAPGYESADVVERVLEHYFGPESVKNNAGGSHQFRVKHRLLEDLPGFGIGGYLSIPISGGKRVKGYYLKRIAQAIKKIEEAE